MFPLSCSTQRPAGRLSSFPSGLLFSFWSAFLVAPSRPLFLSTPTSISLIASLLVGGKQSRTTRRAAHQTSSLTSTYMASPQSTSSAQFWDDFWNTLYQFTHPFSSTFFDSLMDGSAFASDSAIPPVQQERPPAQQQQQNGQKQHFANPATFEKFWQQLHEGHDQGSSSPTTVSEHIQVAWTDMKAAASGFISSVR